MDKESREGSQGYAGASWQEKGKAGLAFIAGIWIKQEGCFCLVFFFFFLNNLSVCDLI